ncbi:DoxX family membrane protein [Tunturibacter empetritectus]|uniref:Membrane protein YphA (DoxX/SURF4 family) n=1 Tax=Tunturiibacter lichenicola TaxID=2051959 RepID=A0A7W8JDG5_9BACT|nr:DoxX family membrane protein [Edaphobacter lichenicola]MBB5345839.1 putative membrane protein YphA (DoxX/SURF4 family) [Edaphobacter lichenicola]
MPPSSNAWICAAGVVVLVIGLVAARRELRAAAGLDKLVAAARVLFAAPLAAFGVEHLALGRVIIGAVPVWMPVRLFWVYFVGVALIAAAFSLALGIRVRSTATLLAIMFLLFVLMIHVPNAVAQVHDRIIWNVAFRDLSFGAGALALVGSLGSGSGIRESGDRAENALVWIGRVIVAAVLMVYGVEQILYPQFAPGVPLSKLTPPWVPGPHVWALLTGLVCIGGGVAILIRRYCRTGATAVGLVMTLLTLFLYLPILLSSSGAAAVLEGANYVWDTLLYAGAVLLVAMGAPRESRNDRVAYAGSASTIDSAR